MSTIFGCTAAVFICWVVFISFSFLNLDAADFFICAVFMAILLLSVYKSVHFIYLVVPLTLVALWSADAGAGYTGRYIYPFVTLPVYVTLHIIVSLLSKTTKIKPKNIIFVTVTAIAALLLMTVLINPFKFELPVWNLKQFLDLRRIWRPMYERIGNNPLNYAHLFSVLYIVNAASIVIWLTVPYLRKVFLQLPNKTDEESQGDTYQLPKIDLALMAIAALTVYMAIRSRRFIPIAAIAACPILAMLIDQTVRAISAARNFHKKNRFCISPMPHRLQLFFTLVGVAAVLTFGIWWGLKFKRVYLDPWPTDVKLNSVFMRMTASDAKPFYAMKFIKDNKLKGKMFNYWTEGGFIAWGQQPDPNTGQTPLQLFMDGRAQAAYEPRVYTLWAETMAGGRIAAQLMQNAQARRRALTTAEYIKIGRWIDKQLKKHNVWVVLMPSNQFGTPFVRGLEANRNWPLVFFNDRQKLFVDITTPQGKELFDGIPNGKTVYPDEFSKDLILAHHLLSSVKGKDAHKQGLDFAIKAFELNRSQVSMLKVIRAAISSELRPRVSDFCRKYFDDFIKNKDSWAEQDGYFHKIASASVAAGYLRQIAKIQRNAELVRYYDVKIKEYNDERKQLLSRKRW